ncbi:hypothetical protein AB0J48_17795 [Nocardia salmonicida]|uniref:hypothetical protein n=1 Tax=Nocardia salmonicida TaxID=53431 RepID=UPI0034173E45
MLMNMVDDADDGRLHGVFIVEGLRPDAVLSDLDIVVRSIRRIAVDAPASDQPKIWTLIDFEGADAAGERLAELFARTLLPGPWYVDFHSAGTTFVTFAGCMFAYARGDVDGRARAAEYGRTVGVPESQLDWR